MTNWYKQSIKDGEFDWSAYNKFYKDKRKKKKSKKTRRKGN